MMNYLPQDKNIIDLVVNRVIEMRVNRGIGIKLFKKREKLPIGGNVTTRKRMALENYLKKQGENPKDIRRVPNVRQGQLTNGVKVP